MRIVDIFLKYELMFSHSRILITGVFELFVVLLLYEVVIVDII